MRFVLRSSVAAAIWVLTAVLLVATTSCATGRIDWESRLGHTTYDQAVMELGPPEKEATLSDGTRVVEWLAQRGYPGGSYSYGGAYWRGPHYGPHYYYAPGLYAYEAPIPSRWLRLIFGPDGRLNAWKQIYR